MERNRLKRRLRELARLRLLPALRTAAAHDIAIRARRDAYDARLDGMATDIDTIAAHLTRPAGDPPAK